MSGLLQKAKGIRLSTIVIPTIIIALLVSGSFIPVIWFEGDMWHKKPDVLGGLQILDVVGDRSSPPATTINKVTFLATIYCGNPGINIANLIVYWQKPSKESLLTLSTSTPTLASAVNFACDEVPIKTPRSGSWDPSAAPPTFFLEPGNVIYITIDLTSQNGIDDPLAAGNTARVLFVGGPGFLTYISFTTPYPLGTNRYIDLPILWQSESLNAMP